MKSCSQKRLIKAHNSGVSCMRRGSGRSFSHAQHCASPYAFLTERINPPGGRRTGGLILKGGAYQTSSLCPSACTAETPPAPGKPRSSAAVTCRDSHRATRGWHRLLCVTAVADGVPPPPCQPSKEQCCQLEPAVASSRGFPTC